MIMLMQEYPNGNNNYDINNREREGGEKLEIKRTSTGNNNNLLSSCVSDDMQYNNLWI